MGDITEFEGKWKVTPPLDEETQQIIKGLRGYPMKIICADQPPHWHFGWKYFPEEQAIGWDGGEKFYGYTKWIQCLLKHVLAPRGYILNGTVHYSNNGGYYSDMDFEDDEERENFRQRCLRYSCEGTIEIVNNVLTDDYTGNRGF